MARCGCDSSTDCSCSIAVVDTNCIDLTLIGNGSVALPYTISASPILDPNPANIITCGPAGLSAEAAGFTGISTTDTSTVDLSGDGTGGSPLTASVIPGSVGIVTTDSGSIDFSGAGTTASPLTATTIAGGHTHDGTGGGTSLVVGGVNEAGATVPTSTSLQSIAIGDFANAGTGTQPIAIGSGTNATSAPGATAQGAIAIGASNAAGIAGARSSGDRSIAIGSGDALNAGASATGALSMAMGTAARAFALKTIAIGGWASAITNDNAIAIGTGSGDTISAASASGQSSIAIGSNTAFGGTGASATGSQSVAIGGGTTAQAGASATAAQSVAIGRTSSATHANAVALGDGVATTNTVQVNIGAKRLFLGVPTTAPADADVINSQTSLWLDETTHDFFQTYKAKTSAGTVKTGGWNLGAWTTFTPSIANLTVGNGTLTGSYNKVGRLVQFRVGFTFGTTSAMGSTPVLTLPTTTAGNYIANVSQIGTAAFLDAGISQINGLLRFVTTTTVEIMAFGSAGTYINPATITATVPFTWADTDQFYLTGEFEAA